MNDHDLLAISELLDKKLQPVYERMDQMEERFDGKLGLLDAKLSAKIDQVHHENVQTRALIENNVIPRLQQIESCYLDTYERYRLGAAKIDALEADVSMLKRIVQEQSKKCDTV